MKQKLFLPIVIAIIFSFVFVAGKYLATAIPPATMSFIRYGMASILFFPFLVKYRSRIKNISKKDWIFIFAAAVMGVVLYHIFFYWALHFTSATNVSLIHAANPLIVLVLSWLFLKQRASKRVVIGFFIAVFGIILIVSEGSLSQLLMFRLNRGELLMLIATTSWAIYTILLKQIDQKKVSSILLTALVSIIGWIILIPFAFHEVDVTFFSSISLQSWLALLYMGIGSSGVGYFLYAKSTRDIGPSITSLMVYSLDPAFVAIVEWLWLGASIGWIQVGGFLCICFG